MQATGVMGFGLLRFHELFQSIVERPHQLATAGAPLGGWWQAYCTVVRPHIQVTIKIFNLCLRPAVAR